VSAPVATAKVIAYSTLTGIGLLAAVVLGEVGIIALVLPFAVALVSGLMIRVRPLPEVTVEIDTSRTVEGARAMVSVVVSALEPVSRCDVALRIPEGLDLEGPTQWLLALRPGSPVVIEVALAAARYGRFVIGPASLRVLGPFGLRVRRADLGGTVDLEVRPRPEPSRSLVRAHMVRPTAGDRLARQPGDGIEFAEARPYQAGTPGRLNWRVTARRGEPYVNLRHPERSTDVVLLVDTFAAVALARQVRAAVGLATAYLARHDRVGLVAFGGILHWVEPAMGQVQLERIVSALTATRWHHSYAWKTAESIPSRTLPATGLVIALSPLEDARMVKALATIRARGVDLAVIETRASPPKKPLSASGELAHRLLRLEHAELRDGLARKGVPVVLWHDGEALEASLGALATWRRRTRGRVLR
jgi:uncharacterized protein (DUF58 family)